MDQETHERNSAKLLVEHINKSYRTQYDLVCDGKRKKELGDCGDALARDARTAKEIVIEVTCVGVKSTDVAYSWNPQDDRVRGGHEGSPSTTSLRDGTIVWIDQALSKKNLRQYACSYRPAALIFVQANPTVESDELHYLFHQPHCPRDEVVRDADGCPHQVTTGCVPQSLLALRERVADARDKHYGAGIWIAYAASQQEGVIDTVCGLPVEERTVTGWRVGRLAEPTCQL